MDIVGLRQGEKLHEELFYETELVEPTSVAKVLRAIAQPPPTCVRDDVRELLTMATGGREDELRTALLDYAIGSGEPQPADLTSAVRRPLQAVPMEIGDLTQPASVVS